VSVGSAIVAATVAVFVDSERDDAGRLVGGRRVGSAFLIEGGRFLTAAHTLHRIRELKREAVDEVDLLFPAIEPGDGGQALIRARRVPAGQAGQDSLDAAVLELAGPAPRWLPSGLRLSSARRWPASVAVFGFPAEDALTGVWRDFTTTEVNADGTVQLDWPGPVGTLPGHSGSPVLDPARRAVVGVLVEGSRRGRFDRFVPLSRITDPWPGLPRRWLLSGADPAAAGDHFGLRATGRRSHAWTEDLFRGRCAAVAAVRDWLAGPGSPGMPLVVTGQPGAGKSSVVARAAWDMQAERGDQPGLAFHARGATHHDLLAAVADLTGVQAAASTGELIAELAGVDGGPWMVVVDALDEIGSPVERAEMVRLVLGLAQLERMRVVVGTRPLTHGPGEARFQAGLLYELKARRPDSPSLVDLDADAYFEPDGVIEYATALLTQAGRDLPATPPAAANGYRSDPALCSRLAGAVAERAGRNYLVAALAADALATEPDTVDPAAPGFDPTSIPASVRDAIDKYLTQLTATDPAWASQVRALLTALAFARGIGIDNRTWLSFAHALGYQPAALDLDELRGSPAADYLLQTIATGDSGAPRTRLFHQALVDELLARRKRDGYPPDDDERAILDTITPPEGWNAADDYARLHAAEHAHACGRLPTLLNDPHYLTVADLPRLLPMLSSDPTDPTGMVLRRVAARAAGLPGPRRARLLALTAAHFGLADLRQQLTEACTELPVPAWAHSIGAAHQELTDHTLQVHGVALGQLDGRDVIVSGSWDGTVRIWDSAGHPVGDPLTGDIGHVHAVALGQLDGRDVIVAGGDDGLQLWDSAGHHPIGDPLDHTDMVTAVALGQLDGRDVIVSGYYRDGTVRIWDSAGHPIGDPLTGHIRAVYAVALGQLDGRDVIVSGGRDGTVWIWDAAGHPIGDPLTGHNGEVMAVALGQLDGRDVIVSGHQHGTVRIWDSAGCPVGEPLTGHNGFVYAVALGQLDGREVIVSSGYDGTVRIWDSAGHPVGDPLTGHAGWVRGVALGRLGRREVIVSGSVDHTVRIWDTAGYPVDEPLTGHTDGVRAVALGQLDGREVIVSGSDDHTVRIWDSAGHLIGDPLDHTNLVTAVALGQLDGRDVIVSTETGDQLPTGVGWEHPLRIWDSAGHPVGDLLTGHTNVVHALALGQLGGREVIVSGSADKTVRIWDSAGHPVGDPLTGHTNYVNAVALGQLDGRDVIVSGSGYWWDGMLRIWDSAGHLVGDLLTGRAAVVRAVALGQLDGREVIVSGSDDETVRIWDSGGHPVGDPLTGHTHTVTAVALGQLDSRDVIVSGSWDRTVRIWDAAGDPIATIDLLEPCSAVALDSGRLCVATGPALSLFSQACRLGRHLHGRFCLRLRIGVNHLAITGGFRDG
jgi:WD40 repeat protein